MISNRDKKTIMAGRNAGMQDAGCITVSEIENKPDWVVLARATPDRRDGGT